MFIKDNVLVNNRKYVKVDCVNFVVVIAISFVFSIHVYSQQKYLVNPIISNYVYHDSSLIKGDDGYYYSFVSSIIPRDTAIVIPYYTVSIFRSRDLLNWDYYKSAFTTDEICLSYVTEYDEEKKRNGKFPLTSTIEKTRYYPVWSPDIIRYNGKYLLFVSLHKSREDSKIAVFESKKINQDFRFVDIVVSNNILDEGAYVNSLELIDPYPFIDKGKLYLFYGSFSRDMNGRHIKERAGIGFYMIQLNSKTLQKVGEPLFITDYYEGVAIIKKKGIYYLFGTNGAWRESSYQICYARSYKLRGPYLDSSGKSISDKNAIFKPISIVNQSKRFNGLGCMSRPIVDKEGKYWILVNGHDTYLPPIVEKKSTAERYTFLLQLKWDNKGNPTILSPDVLNALKIKPVLKIK